MGSSPPGIKPVPSALEALTLSHWIAREVLYQLSVQFISETHQACPHEALCTCSSPVWNALTPEICMAPSLTSFGVSPGGYPFSEDFPDHLSKKKLYPHCSLWLFLFCFSLLFVITLSSDASRFYWVCSQLFTGTITGMKASFYSLSYLGRGFCLSCSYL